jgi:hypothetical protein
MRRWPGIRHVRWLWLAWHLARCLFHVGRYHWPYTHQRDLAYLDRVWKGEA